MPWSKAEEEMEKPMRRWRIAKLELESKLELELKSELELKLERVWRGCQLQHFPGQEPEPRIWGTL